MSEKLLWSCHSEYYNIEDTFYLLYKKNALNESKIKRDVL